MAIMGRACPMLTRPRRPRPRCPPLATQTFIGTGTVTGYTGNMYLGGTGTANIPGWGVYIDYAVIGGGGAGGGGNGGQFGTDGTGGNAGGTGTHGGTWATGTLLLGSSGATAFPTTVPTAAITVGAGGTCPGSSYSGNPGVASTIGGTSISSPGGTGGVQGAGTGTTGDPGYAAGNVNYNGIVVTGGAAGNDYNNGTNPAGGGGGGDTAPNGGGYGGCGQVVIIVRAF